MNVFKDLRGDTIDGISAHLKFNEKCDEVDDGRILYYGINTTISRPYLDKYSEILLNLWSPCEFTVPDVNGIDGIGQMNGFDIVYGVCPYTNKWLRDITSDDPKKYRNICHPHQVLDDNYYAYLNSPKDYDVCYFGGLHGQDHIDCINYIKDFKYRFMSQQSYPEVTNFCVSNDEKLKIVANCKISICYNFVPLNDRLKSYIKKYDKWQDNEAFYYIDSENKMPQMKARFFEAASQFTLNLVKRDPWNVVENYMTPGVDYMEFEDNSELPDLIEHVLTNYECYDSMRKSAFEKSKRYDPKNTYNFIEKDSRDVIRR